MDLAERRDETADALRADLAGVESGEGPSRFAAGHGLMSRVFRFEWREPSLEIDLALPFARVLQDEKSQGEDAAELGAAIRMALLLLAAAGAGTLLQDGEAVLRVSHDGRRAVWTAFGPDGGPVGETGDWSTLVARLETVLPRDERTMSVFLP
jgi:hypothetical protein